MCKHIASPLSTALNAAPTDQLLGRSWKDKQLLHNGEVRESYKHNIYN